MQSHVLILQYDNAWSDDEED
jgi:hypothetical protein